MDDEKTRDARLSEIKRRLAPLVAKSGRKSHGLSHLPEYKIYANMKARCQSIDNPSYGGRGIKVCARWADDFVAFLSDMGFRPSPLHEIERIDNGGDYEPDNCCWATRQEQAQNRRKPNRRFGPSNPRMIEWGGENRRLSEVCKEYGVKLGLVVSRMDRGIPVAQAIIAPAHESVGLSRIKKEKEKQKPERIFDPGMSWSRKHNARWW